MNGMAAKKQRLAHAKRFTEDGVPRDPGEWTERDWDSLYRAFEQAKKEIRGRHEQHRSHSASDR